MVDFSMLRLMDDEERQTICEYRWAGPWPPPERLVLCTGRQSGEQTLSEFEQWNEARNGSEHRRGLAPGEQDQESEFDSHIASQHFVRTRCSKLDDETAAHPHILRGATYVPATP